MDIEWWVADQSRVRKEFVALRAAALTRMGSLERCQRPCESCSFVDLPKGQHVTQDEEAASLILAPRAIPNFHCLMLPGCMFLGKALSLVAQTQFKGDRRGFIVTSPSLTSLLEMRDVQVKIRTEKCSLTGSSCTDVLSNGGVRKSPQRFFA